jgi:NADPH:quinone reductase-like Zn-dependent oxidoreductase
MSPGRARTSGPSDAVYLRGSEAPERRSGAAATSNLSERLRVYGTTSFLRNQRPFRDDWATLFALLEERRIAPVIAGEFPLEQAAEANRLLESGGVVGSIVLRAHARCP